MQFGGRGAVDGFGPQGGGDLLHRLGGLALAQRAGGAAQAGQLHQLHVQFDARVRGLLQGVLGDGGEALGVMQAVGALGLGGDRAHHPQGQGAGDARLQLRQAAGAQGAVALQLAAGLGPQGDADRPAPVARFQAADKGVDRRQILFGDDVAQRGAGQGVQLHARNLTGGADRKRHHALAVQFEQQIGAGEGETKISGSVVGHWEPSWFHCCTNTAVNKPWERAGFFLRG